MVCIQLKDSRLWPREGLLGYSIFIHAGVWKATSLRVCLKRFTRESKTKIAFPRGSGQVFQSHRGVMMVTAIRVSFPKGSYLENWFPKGDFWCHPMEFRFFQTQT